MKFLKRAERKTSIVAAFLLHREKWGSTFMTQYDVAKKLGLTPSKHLMGILMEMVESGDLKVHEVEHRRGVNKRLFSLSRKYAGMNAIDLRAEPTRIIQVKSRGVAQLELSL